MNQQMADRVVKFITKTFSKEEEEICIDFHGGEPLLNFEILQYLVEVLNKRYPDKRKNYSITTNATLLNDKNIDYLVENIKNISVSIDGTRKKHDKFRVYPNGSGSYEQRAFGCSLLFLKWGMERSERMKNTPIVIAVIDSGIALQAANSMKCNIKRYEIAKNEDRLAFRLGGEDQNGHGSLCISAIYKECRQIEIISLKIFDKELKTSIDYLEYAQQQRQ